MALPTSIVLKDLKSLKEITSYVMTMTSKLFSYFFSDCRLTSTLSSTTIKLQRKYEIASENLWKREDSRERDLKVDDGFAFFIVKNGIVNEDCDDEAIANAIFVANLSLFGSLNDDTVVPRYDSDTLSDNVEIVLWYLDFGCSKHMTGHRDKLINFVSKFIRMVRFGNDHFAAIMGYGDLQMGNILILHVYYVKGLDHNLFSVGQFCDLDLEVAFRKHTCFVRNLDGVDLLSGSRGSSLYIVSMADMMESSPIFLLSKASKMKSWLWHHRLSHLNFGTINKLAKQGLVKGLPKLKYTKHHLSLACQMGKRKKQSHPHNPKPSTNEKL
nr:integrase, catalytic region, zinc finger, CCHC-type, peptidase aspartic, catalytic [Tanacetum cinerariifolium]